MEISFRTFDNWEQNDIVKLLPMVKFKYNNTINASINYNSFELNYRYYLCIFFKDKIDSESKFCSTNELAKDQRNLILIY